jgi:PAS domain-containing protein
MAKNGLRRYWLFLVLGFVAVIAIGLLLFTQFRSTLTQYTGFAEKIHEEHIEYIYSTTLANVTLYIEQRYFALNESDWLKQEAKADLLWEIGDEWNKIATAFNLEYIHYMEKSNSGYNLLLSSDKSRGGSVWEDTATAFIDEAMRTKHRTIFTEPANKEHGALVSVVQPVLLGEDASGFLIVSIDSNVSYMEHLVRQETHLNEQEKILLYRIGLILAIAVFIILLLMAFQIWLTRKSFMVPARELETEKRLQLMLDSAPLLCIFLNENGKPLDCNQEALTTFGVENKQDFLEQFFDFCPQNQPNGESSRNLVAQLIKRVQNSGYHRMGWMYLTRTGDELPVELTMIRLPWKNGYRFASYARVLRKTR